MDSAIFSSKTKDSFIGKAVRKKRKPNNFVFGRKVGIIAKLFGCWHDNLSRPFVEKQTAYRCCLECGARKQFNTETLETYGAFYFPPTVKREELF
jgi:hypothetical protein